MKNFLEYLKDNFWNNNDGYNERFGRILFWVGFIIFVISTILGTFKIGTPVEEFTFIHMKTAITGVILLLVGLMATDGEVSLD